MLKVSFTIHAHVCWDSPRKVNREKKKESVQCGGHDFVAYAKEEIARARKSRSYSTARNYGTALRSFLRFYAPQETLLFTAINCELVDAYGDWLLKEEINQNTLSCYMRSLRAIYNKAVDEGLAKQCYPFRNAFTGVARTKKRSIEKQDLRRLREVEVKPGSFMQLVRDVFLFCFYACGMPFIDVAFLKKSQITDGLIVYRRQKTNQFVQIKIEPCMQEIIDRYSSPDREYVFPFLTSTDKVTAHKQFRSKISYYNRVLKDVGKIAGLKVRLSSYVARHTWATMAYHAATDMPVISQALGHTNIKTTQIYVKDIGNHRQNAANRRVLKEVLDIAPLYKS